MTGIMHCVDKVCDKCERNDCMKLAAFHCYFVYIVPRFLGGSKVYTNVVDCLTAWIRFGSKPLRMETVCTVNCYSSSGTWDLCGCVELIGGEICHLVCFLHVAQICRECFHAGKKCARCARRGRIANEMLQRAACNAKWFVYLTKQQLNFVTKLQKRSVNSSSWKTFYWDLHLMRCAEKS